MKKVLVVDDEKPISDIIKFNLTKEGYDVFTAFALKTQPAGHFADWVDLDLDQTRKNINFHVMF